MNALTAGTTEVQSPNPISGNDTRSQVQPSFTNQIPNARVEAEKFFAKMLRTSLQNQLLSANSQKADKSNANTAI